MIKERQATHDVKPTKADEVERRKPATLSTEDEMKQAQTRPTAVA